jgi:hypothetical protein
MMETLAVPIAVLAFLARMGCEPVGPVYLVDDVRIGETSVLAAHIYNVEKGCDVVSVVDKGQTVTCPEKPATYIRRDVADRSDILVHELTHSCQKPTAFGSREGRLNELEAQGAARRWLGE